MTRLTLLAALALNAVFAVVNAHNARTNQAHARQNAENAKANIRFAKSLEAITDEAVNGRLS